MSEIITSEEYNIRGYQEWRKHVNEWKKFRKSYEPIPFLPMYQFTKPDREPRNYGYVLVTAHGANWFRTKREAVKKRRERR
jgi:hypothetical protein